MAVRLLGMAIGFLMVWPATPLFANNTLSISTPFYWIFAAVYTYQGHEYIAFIAGRNSIIKDQVGDQLVVYALPKEP